MIIVKVSILSIVFSWSQGFQKGITCQVTMLNFIIAPRILQNLYDRPNNDKKSGILFHYVPMILPLPKMYPKLDYNDNTSINVLKILQNSVFDIFYLPDHPDGNTKTKYGFIVFL